MLTPDNIPVLARVIGEFADPEAVAARLEDEADVAMVDAKKHCEPSSFEATRNVHRLSQRAKMFRRIATSLRTQAEEPEDGYDSEEDGDGNE